MNRSPRILLINGPLPPPYGGVSTYLAHALPVLVGKGFQVHTVMDKRPADPRQYESFEAAGVHITYGGGSRLAKGLRMLRRFPFWKELERMSGLPPGLLLRTMASQVSWIDAAEQVLRTHDIDIIHAYDYPWVQGFVASVLAKKYGKRYVQTTFGEVVPHRSELEQYDSLSENFMPLVAGVLRSADTVVAMSEHCARELQRVGVARDNVRVTYYGIDTTKFSPSNDGSGVRAMFGWGSRPIVLFLGHIRPRKGPQVLIEAMPAILSRNPEAMVVFAGPDYGMVEGLRRRTAELGVADRAAFIGPQPDAVVTGLYAACDVFAFPTCTPIECLGLSMVQAMATEKPVVGSDINGIPEVIIHGENGFLVPPSEPELLGERICELLASPELRQSMGRKGRKRALEVFDQDNLVRDLESLYRDMTLPDDGTVGTKR